MPDISAILSAVSLTTGGVALVATFASVLVASWLSIQQRPLNKVAHITFTVTQFALLAQMLAAVALLAFVGILSQSLVYYGAGFTAVGAFILFYGWLGQQVNPQAVSHKTRVAVGVAGMAFVLAVTGLTLGQDVAQAEPQPSVMVTLQSQPATAYEGVLRVESAVLCWGCVSTSAKAATDIDIPLELVQFEQEAPLQLTPAVPTILAPEKESGDSSSLPLKMRQPAMLAFLSWWR
jgi:hypothetical protein